MVRCSASTLPWPIRTPSRARRAVVGASTASPVLCSRVKSRCTKHRDRRSANQSSRASAQRVAAPRFIIVAHTAIVDCRIVSVRNMSIGPIVRHLWSMSGELFGIGVGDGDNVASFESRVSRLFVVQAHRCIVSSNNHIVGLVVVVINRLFSFSSSKQTRFIAFSTISKSPNNRTERFFDHQTQLFVRRC